VAANRAEACEEATKVNGSGCSILDNAERIAYPQAEKWARRYRSGGAMAVHDIEEIVREGHATHTCPFHTAQVRAPRTDILGFQWHTTRCKR